MRITRIFWLTVTILVASMLAEAGSRTARDECAPGIAPSACDASAGRNGTPAPTTVLASAEVTTKAPNTAPFVSQHAGEVPALATGATVPALGAQPPITEPLSLVLLGMVLVVAAWTLRHAKAG